MTDIILIVEDEEKLAQLLADYLNQAGFDSHIIGDGNEVVAWVKAHQPQAIMLDLMLPGKNGIEICKEVRQFSQVPILMTTAKVEEIDRLLGLELGADDYLCKPFSYREAVARLKAVLRRATTTDAPANKLHLDEHRLTVTFNQQETTLTQVEFNLLQRLMTHPSRIFSREQLMETMYNDHRIVNNRTIDSHIKKLRKKLADISDNHDWLESVYGSGYRMRN